MIVAAKLQLSKKVFLQFPDRFLELIAGIYNSAGQQVGLCMVELLPGVRNPQNKTNPLNMLQKA